MKSAKIIAMMLAVVLVFSGFTMNAMAAKKTETAASFTPSVTQKGVPAVKGERMLRSNQPQGKQSALEIPADKLALVAFNDRAKAGEDVKAAMENAYEQIVDAKALTELSPELEAVVKESGLKADQLVVRDLFAITLDPEYAKTLDGTSASIALSFDLGLEEGETLIVLQNVAGNEWKTISGDSITRGSNGESVVVFDSLAPIAFVVEKNN